MRMLKRAQNLRCEKHSVIPSDNMLLLDIFFKCDAVNIFHDDILHFFAEADIINLNNIGVRKHGDCLAFIFKAPYKFGIV